MEPDYIASRVDYSSQPNFLDQFFDGLNTVSLTIAKAATVAAVALGTSALAYYSTVGVYNIGMNLARATTVSNPILGTAFLVGTIALTLLTSVVTISIFRECTRHTYNLFFGK